MTRTLTFIDLFCGAGGLSTAAKRVAEKRRWTLAGVAVNHWETAINTHSANHPEIIHVCEPLEAVKPEELAKRYPDTLMRDGRPQVDLLIAAPECTHHSNARGGKPINDQSRTTAFRIFDWIHVFNPLTILIENVPEFLRWGPIDHLGKRIKKRAGEVFQAWVQMFKAFGYTLTYRVLNCADHGDPQTRRRFFLMAVRDPEGSLSVDFPEPTHINPKKVEGTIFTAQFKPWKPARDFIDFELPSKSIFNRPRPLAAKTIERVYAGALKFGWWEPYIVCLRRHMDGVPIDGPIPTLTTGGNLALAQPMTIRYHKGEPRSVDEPFPTQTGTDCFALADPKAFILGHRKFRLMEADDIDDPLRTIDATNGRQIALAQGQVSVLSEEEAFMVAAYGEREGQEARVHSIDAPFPTLCTQRRQQFAQAFAVDLLHGNGRENPAVANMRRCFDLNGPFPTLTTAHGKALVEPFAIQYNGASGPKSLDEPFGTLTAKDRFGLAMPILLFMPDDSVIGLDITLRMFVKKELAAGQSFPTSYIFIGTQEQVTKQIGNAVPGETGFALLDKLCDYLPVETERELERAA